MRLRPAGHISPADLVDEHACRCHTGRRDSIRGPSGGGSVRHAHAATGGGPRRAAQNMRRAQLQNELMNNCAPHSGWQASNKYHKRDKLSPLPTSLHIPGTYPIIRQLKPKLGGANNLGVGVDTQGNEYVLKTGDRLCVAEFIGAALCKVVGIPHCIPNIVCRHTIDGKLEYLFASSIEKGLHFFDQNSIIEWYGVSAQLRDQNIFSVVLALDLAIGNDDRHPTNWLVRAPTAVQAEHELLAMDFSNSWPLCHPPHHPRQQPSINTLSVTKHWENMGIMFTLDTFRKTCATISCLDDRWLYSVLNPMVNIWLTSDTQHTLCQWWSQNWQSQVIEVIHSLETDGDWQ